MRRKKLLDLCCKAGGTSMGYHIAGFEVTGVDIEPQPNYPFEFIQADALTFPLDGYDAIAASPPCYAYSTLKYLQDKIYPELIYPLRARLREAGVPYVMENVPRAAQYMYDPVTLCGSSFGLRCRRHRVFESGGFQIPPMPCNHEWQDRHKVYTTHVSKSRGNNGKRMSGTIPVHGGGQLESDETVRFYKSIALGIDWMTPDELNDAIPPAYTAHIGKALMRELTA